MRIVASMGGGLDSWAMLLEARRRGERPDVAVFCDVSNGSPERDPTDPGEWAGTYRHLREVVMPFCADWGVEFVWLTTEAYPVRDARSLFAWLEARNQIPVVGPKRICTTIAKVERFERWLADRFPGEQVEVWIGFEAGEEKRAAKDPNAGTGKALGRKNRFPLIEWGLCRCRCERLARESGLPVPRKSACKFCPYGTKGDWQNFANQDPIDFARIALLEAKKPPTKNGYKLTIMGFRIVRHKVTREVLRVKAPTLTKFVEGTYKRKVKPCAVCGAADRATKETGCEWLDDAAPMEACA